MSSEARQGLEDLSREDLVDRVVELETAVERLSDAIVNHSEKLAQHREQIEELEWAREILVTDLPTSKKGKRQKIHDILRKAAEDAPRNAVKWRIAYPKAAGAADCSDRHARNLFQEIEESFVFATYDPDGKPHARLVIDWNAGREAFMTWLQDQFPGCVVHER